MVFSTIPAYLDPSNWQQQSTHQTGNISANPQLFSPSPPSHLQPQPPPPESHVGNSGSIRPGSMADRARIANIPIPETALKCPRCDSTNTKFCYFNNYSLTQPRHFCKTCRRYWTRGGSLRNVPVGGGCRRNKSRKGSSSKSPATSSDIQTTSGTTSVVSSNTDPTNILALTPQIQALRFMSPFSHVPDYGSSDLGLNYSGISAPVVVTNEMNFQMGTNFLGGGGGGGVASLLSTGGIEQWRFQQPTQQFPFLGGLDPSSCLFPFQGGVETSGYAGESSQFRPRLSESMLTQFASVKMEDNQESNMARQFLGLPGNNNDQWSGSAWTDLSNFSTSSTSNPL